jgi:hypothetical protein
MLFSVTIRFFVDKPHQAALANSVAAQLEDMQQQYSSLFNQTLLGISWLSLCRHIVVLSEVYVFLSPQGSDETMSTTVGPLEFRGTCEATGGSST